MDELERAEHFRTLVVEPIAAVLRTEMAAQLQPIVKTLEDKEVRLQAAEKAIGDLKANQGKALMGWGVLSLGTAAIMSASWNWLRTHFSLLK